MIGPIVNLDNIADVLGALLMHYLPVAVLGVLVGGAAGWWLARAYGDNIKTEDGTHSWLRNLPITGCRSGSCHPPGRGSCPRT